MTVATSSAFSTRLGSIFGRAPASHHPHDEASVDDGWYIPYREEKPKQGGRARSRTTSGASAVSQPSFFSFDTGQGGIGESPRASYNPPNQNSPRERSSLGSLFNFSGSPKNLPSRSPVKEPIQIPQERRHGLGFLPLALPPTQPLRPRAKSNPNHHPNGPNLRGMPDVHPSLGSASAPPLPPLPSQSPIALNQSRHPYALARSPQLQHSTPRSAPLLVEPYERLQPLPPVTIRNLKSTTSTPNLRKSSSFAKLRTKRSINLAAETWCDALVFPRPRLHAHRLSITPPHTPISPVTPSGLPSQTLKPLDPSNPDAVSLSSAHDALVKAVRDGEKRNLEKEQWNTLASLSFQNARSRSLSRSKRRRKEIEGDCGKDNNKDPAAVVKRGLGLLAESAFSQGPSPSASASSGSTAASHSRNTSVATSGKKGAQSLASRNLNTQGDGYQGSDQNRIRGGERGLVGALSNPDHVTRLYVQLPPVLDSPTFVELKSTKVPQKPAVPERTIDIEVNAESDQESAVGLALSTPTTESVPVSFVSHPYASPNFSFARLPAGPHPSSPPPSVTRFPPQDIGSRHRLPPRGVPAFTYPMPSNSFQAQVPPIPAPAQSVDAAQMSMPYHNDVTRRSLLGAHAYAVGNNDIDETVLGVEEALKRAMKRISVESTHATAEPLGRPRTSSPQAPAVPPRPIHNSPLSSKPAPPVKYEPVRFERVATPPRLSPIEDVATPQSSKNNLGASSSNVSNPTSATNKLYLEKDKKVTSSENLDRSKDSFPSVLSSDSSPTSEHGPRVLSDVDDPELYRNLFYEGSPPMSPHRPIQHTERISYPATAATASSEAWNDRSLSITSVEGLRSLRRRISEDLNIPDLPSTPRISRLRSLDEDSADLWSSSRNDGLRRDHDTIGQGDAGIDAPLSSPDLDHLSDAHIRQSRPERLLSSSHQEIPDIPEDIPSSRASSSLGTSEGESGLQHAVVSDEYLKGNIDYTIRQVERVSIPSVTDVVSRPVSTHPLTSDTGHAGDNSQRNSNAATPFLTPSTQFTRESSYSAGTNDSRMSNIISDFPSPPIPFLPSEHATPSTVLEAYFTAPDNTPLQSREDIRQTMPTSQRGSFGTGFVSEEQLDIHPPTPTLFSMPSSHHS